VLSDGPPPVMDGEAASAEGPETGAELGHAAATVILPPQDPPPS